MPRTCSKCGKKTTVPSFQFWNGRCSDCQSAITIGAWCDDANHPVPTTEEIEDYHLYMDELNAMQGQHLAEWRLLSVFEFATLLLIFGVFFGWFHPITAVGFWTVTAAASAIAIWRAPRRTCPRCGLNVMSTMYHPRSLRTTKCAKCGLRALVQADFRRAAINETTRDEPLNAEEVESRG